MSLPQLRRIRWAVPLLVLAAAACSSSSTPSGPSGPSGTVVAKHHYPAHVRTTYTGGCLPETLGDDRPQPASCVKNVKMYPERWELCLRPRERMTWDCYYVTDYDYRGAELGAEYALDAAFVDDLHPLPTDEWDVP